MDIICTCCGEPWDVDYVLHEEPQGFDRHGSLISACPCCRGVPEHLTDDNREYLSKVKLVAEMNGDDIDGCAAMLDDFRFVGLLDN
jgi:hypothetical protein